MKKRKFADGGIYTAEMGQPPQDIDMASVSPKPMMKKPMPKKMAPKRPMMPVAPKPRSVPSDAPAMPAGMPGMKHGGSVSSRADGIARQGKTKGRMV